MQICYVGTFLLQNARQMAFLGCFRRDFGAAKHIFPPAKRGGVRKSGKKISILPKIRPKVGKVHQIMAKGTVRVGWVGAIILARARFLICVPSLKLSLRKV